MPIVNNLNEISDVYLGSEKITDVYAGNDKIYEEAPAGPLFACYRKVSTGIFYYAKLPLGSDYTLYYKNGNAKSAANSSTELRAYNTFSTLSETSAKGGGLTLTRDYNYDLYS